MNRNIFESGKIKLQIQNHPDTGGRCLSYEVKNNFCLFERPFKIHKNGVFLFEISFFVSEILTFFYYAN